MGSYNVCLIREIGVPKDVIPVEGMFSVEDKLDFYRIPARKFPQHGREPVLSRESV